MLGELSVSATPTHTWLSVTECPTHGDGVGNPGPHPHPPAEPYASRVRTRLALWPPKPKLLLIATSTRASRATLGT